VAILLIRFNWLSSVSMVAGNMPFLARPNELVPAFVNWLGLTHPVVCLCQPELGTGGPARTFQPAQVQLVGSVPGVQLSVAVISSGFQPALPVVLPGLNMT